jgi:hypothetical protein
VLAWLFLTVLRIRGALPLLEEDSRSIADALKALIQARNILFMVSSLSLGFTTYTCLRDSCAELTRDSKSVFQSEELSAMTRVLNEKLPQNALLKKHTMRMQRLCMLLRDISSLRPDQTHPGFWRSMAEVLDAFDYCRVHVETAEQGKKEKEHPSDSQRVRRRL